MSRTALRFKSKPCFYQPNQTLTTRAETGNERTAAETRLRRKRTASGVIYSGLPLAEGRALGIFGRPVVKHAYCSNSNHIHTQLKQRRLEAKITDGQNSSPGFTRQAFRALPRVAGSKVCGGVFLPVASQLCLP